jgi:hypothetical protein
MKPRAGRRVVVENVNVPGYRSRVDGDKYADMKQALLTVLRGSAGLTQAEMISAVVPHLSQTLFPGGAKSGWWVKCVQLDLEAKQIMVRDGGKPLRWRLT